MIRRNKKSALFTWRISIVLYQDGMLRIEMPRCSGYFAKLREDLWEAIFSVFEKHVSATLDEVDSKIVK